MTIIRNDRYPVNRHEAAQLTTGDVQAIVSGLQNVQTIGSHIQMAEHASYATTSGTATSATDAPDRIGAGTGQAAESNTTAPRTMATYTIPAGALGASDNMETVILAVYQNNTGAAQNVTVRCTLGIAVIATDTFSVPSSASILSYQARIVTAARGSLSSQINSSTFTSGGTVSGASGVATVRSQNIPSTLNMAVAQTLVVEVILGAANASLIMSHRYTGTNVWR